MKMSIKVSFVLLALTSAILPLHAQSSAFTYQGRLNDSGQPATGIYDLRFTLFDALSGGTVRGGTVNKPATPVTNGLFTVTLDFGAGAFDGADRWLEIAAGANGAPVLTPLAPRQPVTATPYAVRAANFSGAVGDGQLSGNIARLNSSPAFTGTITAGGFSGGGAGLTNVPGTIPWQTTAASSVSAQANQSYRATGTNTTLVNLPTTAATGDVVRVSGLGSGGWQVAPGGTQVIQGGLIGEVWVPHNPVLVWRSVASSADGLKLVAVSAGVQPVYTSTDGGNTWTARPTNGNWMAVASSTNGTLLLAADYGGRLYTSADSGATWIPRDSARNWQSVASSADGGKLVAVEFGGRLYTSKDSGATWAPRNSDRNWYSVASSADGTKLAAVVAGGQIYTSSDSGLTWTPRESNRSWRSIASSADGTRLAAVVEGGQIYLSTDSGLTWTPRASDRSWKHIASSDDGTRLVALEYSGRIHTSGDGGATWMPHESSRAWIAAASSADGSRLVALVDGGQIYTSSPGLSGAQGSSVELQYVGGGQWQQVQPAFTSLQVNGPVTANAFSGGGAALTGLNASELNTGTVPDARLDANVARLNANQTFTGTNIFNNRVGLGTATPGVSLEVIGGIRAKGGPPGPFGNNNAGYAFSGVGGGDPDSGLFSTADGQLEFYNNAVERLRINPNGNVGIGTANPADRLSVKGGALSFHHPGTDFPYVGLDYDATGDALRLRANLSGSQLNTDLLTIKRTTGAVGIGTNAPQSALHVQGTVSAAAFGGIGTNAVELQVNGLRALRLEDNGDSSDPDSLRDGAPNVIGGSPGNYVAPGIVGATIGGGGATNSLFGAPYPNHVASNFGTVGGGLANTASGDEATVGGGQRNLATGFAATVGGGHYNRASGDYANVGGGNNNIASGEASTVPCGWFCEALGSSAFAAGMRAKAIYDGSFVWGDTTVADVNAYSANSVTMRASGGYYFYSNPTLTSGAVLPAGGGAWSNMSDRESKEDFAEVSAREVLEKVAALPMHTWKYKSQDAAIRHLGPVAQDFHAAFGVGETNTCISTVDADGVALAAIQGLNAKVEDRSQRLEAENAELKQRLTQLEELVRKLAAQPNGGGR